MRRNMNTTWGRVLPPLLVASLTLWLAACAARPVADSSAVSGTEIVRAECVACHDLGRVCARLGDGYAAWTDRLERMRAWGAPLDAGRLVTASARLSLALPGDPAFCGDDACIPCDATHERRKRPAWRSFKP